MLRFEIDRNIVIKANAIIPTFTPFKLHLLNSLLYFETPLFLWLNKQNNDIFDAFMWLITLKWTWIPIVIGLLIISFYKTQWRKGVIFIIVIIICVTLADQLSDALLKQVFLRLRPSHHPSFRDQVNIVNGYLGGDYGFVSSHAANAFAIAVILHSTLRTRVLSLVVFLWAILSSYSRIYLGVHFISDVLFGSLLGITIGYLCYLGYHYVMKKYALDTEDNTSFIPRVHIVNFSLTWLLYLVFLFAISIVLHEKIIN